MICPYCNRHEMYKGSNGQMRCPYCHDTVTPAYTGSTISEVQEAVDKVTGVKP